MRRIVRLAPVVLLSLFVGCSDSTAPASLTLNRLRWERQNLHDYVYTARRMCFCPESGEEVFVLVKSDEVLRVTVVATGLEVPKAGWNTVPQLFDLVERSFGENYARVGVEYDSELGYPTQINLVCHDTTLDCGLAIGVKDLSPVGFLE